LKCDALIIGGGVAGLAVAETLLPSLQVTVLEEERLGGLAWQLGCKATTECLACGVCRSLEMKRKASRFPVLLGERITTVERQNGGFKITTQKRAIETRFVVIATGASPFPPQRMPQFGFGTLKWVYSGFDLEKKLNREGLNEFAPFHEIAFIQCVGSRNFQEKRGYCSQVCCRYALRLAENLLFRFPHLHIDFYYMDLQVFGKKSEKLWETSEKVKLIRNLPFAAEEGNGKLSVVFEGERGVSREKYDAIILSVGMIPSSGTKRMVELLHLTSTVEGFIKDYGGGVTSQEGILVCGTASGPKDIETSTREARMVGEKIKRMEN